MRNAITKQCGRCYATCECDDTRPVNLIQLQRAHQNSNPGDANAMSKSPKGNQPKCMIKKTITIIPSFHKRQCQLLKLSSIRGSNVVDFESLKTTELLAPSPSVPVYSVVYSILLYVGILLYVWQR